MNNIPHIVDTGASVMNNEPVAWIPFAWYCAWLGENNEPVWEQYEECHPATKQWDNFPDKIIPLYTHPVKDKPHPKCDEACMYLCQMRELTDEEILAVGNAVVNLIDSNEGWLEFARAILRKAQEK